MKTVSIRPFNEKQARIALSSLAKGQPDKCKVPIRNPWRARISNAKKECTKLNSQKAMRNYVDTLRQPDHPVFGKLYPTGTPNVEPKYCTAAEESNAIKETEWEWPGWIAIGILIGLIAREGRGKTWLLWAIVKSIVTCAPWPDGTPGPTRPRKVIWCETESSQAINRTRRKILMIPEEWVIIPGGPLHDFQIDNPEHISNLKRLIEFHKPGAVIIDSLTSGVSFPEGSPAMRPVVLNLVRIARDYNVPIIVSNHVRKKPAGSKGDQVDTHDAKGNSAIGHYARISITLHRPDPDDHPNRLEVGQDKNSLMMKPDPLGMVLTKNNIRFTKEPSKPARKGSQLKEAKDIIEAALKDGKKLLRNDVMKLGKEAGISEATMKEASEQLGVQKKKRKGDGKFVWWMPKKKSPKNRGK